MNRHEQWSVGEQPSLDIGVPVGLVEVRTGDAGIIQLTLESAAAADFEISCIGDRVSVRHPSRWSMRGRNCRLVVTVPAGTDVTVDAASAEVRLSGRLGAVRVRTASGDVQIDGAQRLELSTASGEITCGTVDGDASINTISGDCSVNSVGGRFDATLTSGDLRVDTCGGDLTVASTSGSARVGHCGGSDIVLRSISGDLRLGLPSGVRVDADISTVSGSARLPEPPATATAAEGDRRPVRLRLKTVSGDIRLERSR
jgi:hypothetical protein